MPVSPPHGLTARSFKDNGASNAHSPSSGHPFYKAEDRKQVSAQPRKRLPAPTGRKMHEAVGSSHHPWWEGFKLRRDAHITEGRLGRGAGVRARVSESLPISEAF